jgi:DeoR/GlpR family transcriptional regulator of sugar metabolism
VAKVPAMNAFDRRSSILDYIQKHRRASTRQLSEIFKVSEVTIRNDLENLEQNGWLARRHGGAEISLQTVAEQPFDLRTSQHRDEKVEIAQSAARLIQSGDQVILDSSTSAYQLALQLVNHRDLIVITNNLQAASTLTRNPGIEVIFVGGLLRNETGSAVGLLAEEMLSKLHARRGFFGTAGLTLDRGLTDADIREVQVKRSMISAVDEVNVLLDSSKFGQHALLTFANLSQVNNLYTNNGIPEKYTQICRELGINLTII